MDYPLSHVRAKATALRLIKKHGRTDVVLLRPDAGQATNPSRPWKAESLDGPDTATVIGKGTPAVFTDVREVRAWHGRFGLGIDMRPTGAAADSLAPLTSAIAYMPPDEVVTRLRVGDQMTTQGRRYEVVRCDPLQLGDLLILYTVQLKEG